MLKLIALIISGISLWCAAAFFSLWAFTVISLHGYKASPGDSVAVAVYAQIAAAVLSFVSAVFLTRYVWKMGELTKFVDSNSSMTARRVCGGNLLTDGPGIAYTYTNRNRMSTATILLARLRQDRRDRVELHLQRPRTARHPHQGVARRHLRQTVKRYCYGNKSDPGHDEQIEIAKRKVTSCGGICTP